MTLTSQNVDESLILRAKAGEVGAWEQIIVRYQDSLRDYIRGRYAHCLPALTSPEDILQEALLQAWLDIGSLRQTSSASFFAWLKAVADSRMWETLRRQQRLKRGGRARRATNRNTDDSGQWHDLLDALPADAKTASSILSHQETARALQVAVSLLPEDQQTALRMHYLEGKTLAETAGVMNRTNAAVRGLLHRGKQRLANDLASASSWLGARTDVTRLLAQIESGDQRASDELLPRVYDELRQLAARKLSQEKPGQTLQATALVHEAFLRLVGTDQPRDWQSRGHFFSAAAEAMRRILIDRARKKKSQRHGGGLARQPLHEVEIAAPEPSVNLLALDEALQGLATVDPAKAKLVKLRYFAGLSIPQAAEALGISTTTADRYWAFARAWLHTEMKKGDHRFPE